MPEAWSAFSYIVTNLARFIRPGEVTFSGVNSTPAMLACLLAKRAYDFDFVYINVAGGVQPTPSKIPISSSDPVLAEGSSAIFANEDFYDLCTRGGMDLCFLGAAQVDGLGRTNVSAIGDWHNPKVRLPGGGGGAVMLPTARRAVTWRTEHSKRTMVEKLDFVTASTIDPSAQTAFGGHCYAPLFDNTNRLGEQYPTSNAFGSEAPVPVVPTTWGKIKNLYH